jgi:membrane fusion protein, multidrug efflux system
MNAHAPNSRFENAEAITIARNEATPPAAPSQTPPPYEAPPPPPSHEPPPLPPPEAVNTPPVKSPVEPTPEAPRKKRRPGRILLMVAVPLLLAGGGGWFYLNGGRYEETDNAYVQQPIIALSADVAGRITAVEVAENDTVTSGEVLFRLDPEPYQIALNQAEAALAAARVNVDQLRVAYQTAGVKLENAQSALELRQAEFDRQNSLVERDLSPESSLDDVRIALQSAQSAVTLAQQDVANAKAALAGNPDIATEDHPAVRSAQAQVESASRNLAKTTITAPADGIVAQLGNVNVGQFVAAGTNVASLVETDQTWIEANFKETQLSELRTGLPAEIRIDAFPDHPLEGQVSSIGAATGSEFSLIPAQNATGNWVKVVQRIPVRIQLDDASEEVLLRTGMSATISVDTGHNTLDRLQGR